MQGVETGWSHTCASRQCGWVYQHRAAGSIQGRRDTLQTSVSVGWAEYPGRKADEVVLHGSGKDWSQCDTMARHPEVRT